MKKLTHEEFCYLNRTAYKQSVISPSLRKGQVFMNVLNEFHPEIYKEIVGTDVDPFYDNSRMRAFLKHIQENYIEKCI
jgi:hypothetical protein